MTNTQGNLFEQPIENRSNQPKPADKARLELTPEAAELRARERKARQRRTDESAQKRQGQIDRAAEQGVDIRTHSEVKRDSDRQGLDAMRKAIEDTS